jgi:RNA polymerase sigma factor for flagellar operon FliA
MRKIENAMNQMQQKLGRPPTETETKSLKLSLGEYQGLLGDSGGHQLVYTKISMTQKQKSTSSIILR